MMWTQTGDICIATVTSATRRQDVTFKQYYWSDMTYKPTTLRHYVFFLWKTIDLKKYIDFSSKSIRSSHMFLKLYMNVRHSFTHLALMLFILIRMRCLKSFAYSCNFQHPQFGLGYLRHYLSWPLRQYLFLSSICNIFFADEKCVDRICSTKLRHLLNDCLNWFWLLNVLRAFLYIFSVKLCNDLRLVLGPTKANIVS